MCIFFFGISLQMLFFFFFSSRRRHTRSLRDWSSDVCSSDLCRLPLMRAPRSGCWAENSSRIAISPGISVSAIRISLRPHSASARSATAKSAPAPVRSGNREISYAALISRPPFVQGFASAVGTDPAADRKLAGPGASSLAAVGQEDPRAVATLLEAQLRLYRRRGQVKTTDSNPIGPLLQVVDEIVGRALGVAPMQFHAALGAGVLAATPGHHERRVAGVVERTLDGDQALLQDQGPEALPALADHGAQAVALVGADLNLVGGVEHRIGEHQQVADGVALSAQIDGLLVGRMLDDRQALAGLHGCRKRQQHGCGSRR